MVHSKQSLLAHGSWTHGVHVMVYVIMGNWYMYMTYDMQECKMQAFNGVWCGRWSWSVVGMCDVFFLGPWFNNTCTG